MKKSIALIFALVFIFSLTSCGNSADTSAWQSNEVFNSVPVYKYGDTISAEFAAECNIKINDDSYDNFVKYIEDLKKAGFEYVSIKAIPENYSLSNGSAQWRCSNGKVHLQLIFNESSSSTYKMFNCNLQIYGYSKMPNNWKNS